jgi:hypothetical protein
LAEVQLKLNLNEFYFLGLAHKEFIVDVLWRQLKEVSTNRRCSNSFEEVKYPLLLTGIGE